MTSDGQTDRCRHDYLASSLLTFFKNGVLAARKKRIMSVAL